MKPHYVFFSSDGKLRSGWRAATFVAAFVFFWLIIGAMAFAVMSILGFSEAGGSGTILVINGGVSLVAALLIGWVCGKYLESLPFRALGASFTNGWLKHLIFGNLIGAATVSAAVGIASIFGSLDFSLSGSNPNSILRTLLISLCIFAVAAAFEEALFRGYMLQTFTRSGFGWLAILITAVFFGAVHLGNPNSGYLSSLNTAIAGIWFGVAYLKTRDLWFVWGLHLMWNWMQGAIYGIEVSGLTDIVRSPLLNEIDGGPAWLTGGDYGIEASISCTLALVASTLVIHYFPFLKPSQEMLAYTSPKIGAPAIPIIDDPGTET